jgi:hypothetical protein
VTADGEVVVPPSQREAAERAIERAANVARQLGHDARLTLTTYGPVIDELDDQPRVPAEDAIAAARHTSCVPGGSREAADRDAG